MSEVKPWNPPYPIYQRLPMEALIGCFSAFTVAPFVTIVDKAVVQNASGSQKLLPSMIESTKALLFKPITFMKSVPQLWLYTVYAGTYTSANSVDAFCKHYGYNEVYPKLGIVFMVNMTLSILKDRALVQLFGTIKPAPIPAMSYFFWSFRDIFTVLSAFILPKKLSIVAEQKLGVDRNKAETTITFWCPILLQLVSTPLHLMGLDYYNKRDSKFAERVTFIRGEYVKTVIARMFRMTPAYGIGGVLNLSLRKHFFGDLNAKRY